jgi:DNA repair exonuclease SbcCD ATPase subunit
VSATDQANVASRLLERIQVLEKRCRALEPLLTTSGGEENVCESSIQGRAERDAKVRELEFFSGELERLRQEIEKYEDRGDVVAYIEDECAFLSEIVDALDEFRREVRSVLARDLEDAVNLFLERFSDGDFDARLSITEDFGLEIMLHGRKVPLFNLSGAARDLLAISLRCGLYRIAAREIDFLLLDEPTRHLDSTNIRRLKDAFDGIGDHQLIVITVNDEFADAVGTKYVVGKDDRMISEIRRLDAVDDTKKSPLRPRSADATVLS